MEVLTCLRKHIPGTYEELSHRTKGGTSQLTAPVDYLLTAEVEILKKFI